MTTSSPEAQAFYDQRLAYLHAFVWIEAARSFHQALRMDPNLVMAYLGLTDTYIGLQDVATARSAFQRAQELERTASDRERIWITIRQRELDYLENSADQNNYALYRQALKEALKLNPNDPWLWIQRALADESSPFTHGQAGGVDTLSFYKTAVTLAPGNSAAHHYYIMRTPTRTPAKQKRPLARRKSTCGWLPRFTHITCGATNSCWWGAPRRQSTSS